MHRAPATRKPAHFSMKALTPIEITDFERLEKVVESGQQTFVEVGLALTEIRDRRLYRKDFDTFEAYCQSRWGWSRRRGNQLIEAAEVVEHLPKTLGTTVPNERVARELSRLPVPQQKEVIKEAIQSGKPLTAPAVKAKVPPPVVKPTPKPATPPTRLDATGYPIPAKVLPLWDEATEIQQMLSALSTIRGALRNAQEHQNPIFAEVNFSLLLSSLDQAYTSIKTVKPHAVCPTCQGRFADTCRLCEKRGFISEFRWQNAVPRETKEIRMKSLAK